MPTLLAAEIVVAENEREGGGRDISPSSLRQNFAPLSLPRALLSSPSSRVSSHLIPLSFPPLLPREKMIHDLLISQNSLAT